jgi:hypothetical protein
VTADQLNEPVLLEETPAPWIDSEIDYLTAFGVECVRKIVIMVNANLA